MPATKYGLPLTTSSGTKETRKKHQKVVAAQKKANMALPCAVSGCDKNRSDLYPYCYNHSRRYRKYGHPTLERPTAPELRSLEAALKEWLDKDLLTTKADREAFKKNWAAGQQTIRNHPSFALPFFRLEGSSGFTQKAKGWVILSHYFHNKQNSLSDAMLRYMAARLWTEFKWKMPEGSRKGFQKERDLFANTWAGKFVLANSGFSKTTQAEKIVAWQRPWYVSEDPSQNLPQPITETVTKIKRLDAWVAGPIVRAIGDELKTAVEHALGNKWLSDHRLLERASEALGLPNSTPSINQHFT